MLVAKGTNKNVSIDLRGYRESIETDSIPVLLVCKSRFSKAGSTWFAMHRPARIVLQSKNCPEKDCPFSMIVTKDEDFELIRKAGIARVVDITNPFPANERDRVLRCLGWMLKHGVAVIET